MRLSDGRRTHARSCGPRGRRRGPRASSEDGHRGQDGGARAGVLGFTQWPDQVVQHDLGRRRLELVGIPGHDAACIAVHDESTGLLFSGDSAYPGRMYVADFEVYLDSMNRLVEFAEAREVSQVFGCHIEMTREPRRDYPFGCRYQPDEPPLQMSVAQLRSLRDAASSVARRPGEHPFDDFVIYNGMGARTQLPLLGRGIAARVQYVLPRRRQR